VRAEYKAALARAGLRAPRFHDLRHTFGTRAVEQAESILELGEWMGHAKVQTTMRYPLQVRPTRKAWLMCSQRPTPAVSSPPGNTLPAAGMVGVRVLTDGLSQSHRAH
jgi:hypothetical protein